MICMRKVLTFASTLTLHYKAVNHEPAGVSMAGRGSATHLQLVLVWNETALRGSPYRAMRAPESAAAGMEFGA
jgi:hypothetical protein